MISYFLIQLSQSDSVVRVQGTSFPAGESEPCARCAGFSMVKIGNRKERLRVREAGASAAGRGQRPYASFPDLGRRPKNVPLLSLSSKQRCADNARVRAKARKLDARIRQRLEKDQRLHCVADRAEQIFARH